jgi:hypothetical protein
LFLMVLVCVLVRQMDRKKWCQYAFGDSDISYGKIYKHVVANHYSDSECHICGFAFSTINAKTGEKTDIQMAFIHSIQGNDRLICRHCEKMSINIAIGKRPPPEDYEIEGEWTDWDEDRQEAISMRLEDRFSTFNPDGYSELLLKRVQKRLKESRRT